MIEKEKQLIAMLAEGITNKEMMDRLRLSRRGVAYHLKKIFQRNGLYGKGDSRRAISLAARGLLVLVALSCFSRPVHAQTCASTWTNGYTYCRALTVASGQIPGSLTAYPIPFCFNMTGANGNACPTATDLKTAANAGKVQNTVTFNGQTCPADMNFYSDNAGTTALSWDCASYTATNGALEVYVNKSVTTGANYVYLFYDKSAQTTYTGGAVGAAYDANYKCIHHLANGSTVTYLDSTSNACNGTAQGSGNAAQATAQIDGGLSVNGSGGETVGIDPTYAAMTVECWAYTTMTGPQFMGNGNSGNASFTLNTSWPFLTFIIGNGTSIGTAYAGPISTSTPYYLVGTYDGTTVSDYVNGTVGGGPASQSGAIAASGLGLSGMAAYIGNVGATLTGWMDEVRISNVSRSANWITATYNAESAPSTWFSSAAPATSGGATSVKRRATGIF